MKVDFATIVLVHIVEESFPKVVFAFLSTCYLTIFFREYSINPNDVPSHQKKSVEKSYVTKEEILPQ